MPLVRRAPHPALAGLVRSYYGFREDTVVPLRRREGPAAAVVVVISFGHEWRIGDAREPERPFTRHVSFVAGLHDGAVLTEHDGTTEGIQVNLEPTAASVLVGVPMRELARRVVPLEALLGREAEALVEQLYEARGWDSRLGLLEAALARRLRDARSPSAEIDWAWRRLRETGGAVRISALARELGWSRRRLAAGFHDEVGLAPKAAARLLRIERAVDLVAREPGSSWARVAAACGYYDQAHLVNEFRAITGTTPTAFVAERAA